ncbi:unnamed protein product [Caenorhabditis nigoni]
MHFRRFRTNCEFFKLDFGQSHAQNPILQHHALQPSRTINSASFTGESLSLKNSDLTLPNKAAHFLYFQCYEDHETVARFVETGETDPREIINKIQASRICTLTRTCLRRYSTTETTTTTIIMETQWDTERSNRRLEEQRICSVSKRRRLESRINRMLDARPPGKNHNDVMSKWLQTLETTRPDEYGLMVPERAASIREHLDEMLGEPNGEGVRSSQIPNKRIKMMVGEDEEVVDHVVEEVDTDGILLSKRTIMGTGFDGKFLTRTHVRLFEGRAGTIRLSHATVRARWPDA